MMCRVVEHVQRNQPTWRFDGVGRTIIATTGDAMGELAVSTEPGQHIGSRQSASWPNRRMPSRCSSSTNSSSRPATDASSCTGNGARKPAVASTPLGTITGSPRRCSLPGGYCRGEPSIGDAHPEPANCRQ